MCRQRERERERLYFGGSAVEAFVCELTLSTMCWGWTYLVRKEASAVMSQDQSSFKGDQIGIIQGSSFKGC